VPIQREARLLDNRAHRLAENGGYLVHPTGIVMGRPLAESEEAQDCDNDYDCTNEPNYTIHENSPLRARLRAA
jgi:hypothetical protein